MEDKKGVSNKLKLIIGVLSIFILLIIIILFIVFYSTPKKVISKTEKGGDVTLSYTSGNNQLSITNATPLSDSVAIDDLSSDNYIEFSVDTDIENSNSVTYELSVKKNEDISTIADSDIKIYLEKEVNGTYKVVYGPKEFVGLKKDSDLGTKKGYLILNKVTNRKDTTDNYRLKIWLSNNAVINDTIKNYSVKVYVKAKSN